MRAAPSSDLAFPARRLIAGIDEAGRGCLAGPVIAAAVVFDPGAPVISGLDDSKRLSPPRRRELASQVWAMALACSVGRADASEVDMLNVLRASLLAMRRAFLGLAVKPEWVRVDGSHFPELGCSGQSVVHGDAIHYEIMAASIVAKVVRDREMDLLDQLYPGYGFVRHKGYPTAEHRAALEGMGSCPVHRTSFAPVRRSER